MKETISGYCGSFNLQIELIYALEKVEYLGWCTLLSERTLSDSDRSTQDTKLSRGWERLIRSQDWSKKVTSSRERHACFLFQF